MVFTEWTWKVILLFRKVWICYDPHFPSLAFFLCSHYAGILWWISGFVDSTWTNKQALFFFFCRGVSIYNKLDDSTAVFNKIFECLSRLGKLNTFFQQLANHSDQIEWLFPLDCTCPKTHKALCFCSCFYYLFVTFSNMIETLLH